MISGGRSARSTGYGRHVVKEILGPIPVRASIGRERSARDDPGCSRVGTGRGDGDPMQHVSRRRNRRHPPHNRYGAQGGAEFMKRSCVCVRAANRCSRFRIHPRGPCKKGLLLGCPAGRGSIKQMVGLRFGQEAELPSNRSPRAGQRNWPTGWPRLPEVLLLSRRQQICRRFAPQLLVTWCWPRAENRGWRQSPLDCL